jgi:hypothetical protein
MLEATLIFVCNKRFNYSKTSFSPPERFMAGHFSAFRLQQYRSHSERFAPACQWKNKGSKSGVLFESGFTPHLFNLQA